MQRRFVPLPLGPDATQPRGGREYGWGETGLPVESRTCLVHHDIQYRIPRSATVCLGLTGRDLDGGGRQSAHAALDDDGAFLKEPIDLQPHPVSGRQMGVSGCEEQGKGRAPIRCSVQVAPFSPFSYPWRQLKKQGCIFFFLFLFSFFFLFFVGNRPMTKVRC